MDWDAWLFRLNPERFDIAGLFSDGVNALTSLSLGTNWLNVSDRHPFALYVSGPEYRGIYLIGHLVDGEYTDTGGPGWIDLADRKKKRHYIDVAIDKAFLKTPITLDEMRKAKTLDRVTKSLGQRGGSPMGLTKAEWNLIDKWAKKRRGSRKLPKSS